MVASIQSRIYYRLNQPMVAKSKKVKVKSQRRSKPSCLIDFTRLKSGDPVEFHGDAVVRTSIRAGELESWSWKASWKL